MHKSSSSIYEPTGVESDLSGHIDRIKHETGPANFGLAFISCVFESTWPGLQTGGLNSRLEVIYDCQRYHVAPGRSCVCIDYGSVVWMEQLRDGSWGERTRTTATALDTKSWTGLWNGDGSVSVTPIRGLCATNQRDVGMLRERLQDHGIVKLGSSDDFDGESEGANWKETEDTHSITPITASASSYLPSPPNYLFTFARTVLYVVWVRFTVLLHLKL
jgi:hypothetical protein